MSSGDQPPPVPRFRIVQGSNAPRTTSSAAPPPASPPEQKIVQPEQKMVPQQAEVSHQQQQRNYPFGNVRAQRFVSNVPQRIMIDPSQSSGYYQITDQEQFAPQPRRALPQNVQMVYPSPSSSSSSQYPSASPQRYQHMEQVYVVDSNGQRFYRSIPSSPMRLLTPQQANLFSQQQRNQQTAGNVRGQRMVSNRPMQIIRYHVIDPNQLSTPPQQQQQRRSVPASLSSSNYYSSSPHHYQQAPIQQPTLISPPRNYLVRQQRPSSSPHSQQRQMVNQVSMVSPNVRQPIMRPPGQYRLIRKLNVSPSTQEANMKKDRLVELRFLAFTLELFQKVMIDGKEVDHLPNEMEAEIEELENYFKKENEYETLSKRVKSLHNP